MGFGRPVKRDWVIPEVSASRDVHLPFGKRVCFLGRAESAARGKPRRRRKPDRGNGGNTRLRLPFARYATAGRSIAPFVVCPHTCLPGPGRNRQTRSGHRGPTRIPRAAQTAARRVERTELNVRTPCRTASVLLATMVFKKETPRRSVGIPRARVDQPSGPSTADDAAAANAAAAGDTASAPATRVRPPVGTACDCRRRSPTRRGNAWAAAAAAADSVRSDRTRTRPSHPLPPGVYRHVLFRILFVPVHCR